MKTCQHNQFCQKVIFRQMRFGLVGVKRFEVFWHDILLSFSLLYIVFFEHCVPEKIAIRDVVKNRVT